MTKFIPFDLKFKFIHADYVGDSVQSAHEADSYLDECISRSSLYPHDQALVG